MFDQGVDCKEKVHGRFPRDGTEEGGKGGESKEEEAPASISASTTLPGAPVAGVTKRGSLAARSLAALTRLTNGFVQCWEDVALVVVAVALGVVVVLRARTV